MINNKIHSDIKEMKYFQDKEDGFPYFGKIEDVNIFVGANNSGKSRFLRGLLKSNEFSFISSTRLEIHIYILCSFLEKNQTILESDKLNNNSLTLKLGSGPITIGNAQYVSPDLEFLLKNSTNKNIIFNEDYFIKFIEELKNSLNFKDDFEQKKESLAIKKAELVNAIFFIESDDKGKIAKLRQLGFITSFNYPPYKGSLASLKKIVTSLDYLLNIKVQKTVPDRKIYIPILRTANVLSSDNSTNQSDATTIISQDIFEGTIYKNYEFSDLEENKIRITTGLNLYKSIRKIRNSERPIRKRFEKFEDFISKSFFGGRQIELIAKESERSAENAILIYIDGEEERLLHNVGDGIQALILLLYPIYTAEENTWFFIEEPEINLHPGLQRIFLEQLITNKEFQKKKLKFFITTHSNHFLDLSLTKEGVSILTFDKKRLDKDTYFQIDNVKSTDVKALRFLGVNNSSVFMSNCSIWVEGITDRLYLRAYLKAYFEKNKGDGKKYHEDLHYSFYEYAGSNLAHYLFSDISDLEESENDLKSKINAQFLSNRIFLLADKDNGKTAKHNSLFSEMKDNFHYEVLDAREIENLLSPQQLKKYLPKLSRKFKTSIVEKKKFSGYEDKYLGKYLKEKFKTDSPKGLNAKSGTLSTYYKNKLAEITVEEIKWDDMSSEAKALAEKVANFIKECNS